MLRNPREGVGYVAVSHLASRLCRIGIDGP